MPREDYDEKFEESQDRDMRTTFEDRRAPNSEEPGARLED